GQVLARELGGQLQLLGRHDRGLVTPSHVIFVVIYSDVSIVPPSCRKCSGGVGPTGNRRPIGPTGTV
ncbi:MAG: hypothetical protein ABJA50_12580, partial [Chloroflexota bacterium]